MKNAILLLHCDKKEDTVHVSLLSNDESTAQRPVAFSSDHSQELLSAVMDTFNEGSMQPADCEGVVVVQGAQRFTIARLVTVLANAFSWSMNIPVAETADVPTYTQATELLNNNTKTVSAQYSGEPTIN